MYLLTLNKSKSFCGCGPIKNGFKPVMLSRCYFSNTWLEISTYNPVGLTNSSNLADIKTSGTNQVPHL